MRFRRISSADVDPHRVTLFVLQGPDGILGRVSTLAYGDDGIEMMTTEGADPPIDVALLLAAEVAGFKEEDIDVVDPDGLWQPAWGDLTAE